MVDESAVKESLSNWCGSMNHRTMPRYLGHFDFNFIGTLQVDRDASGNVVTLMLSKGAPNRRGSGPFCRFKLPGARPEAGVYAIFVGRGLRYIGKTGNLVHRFGELGYGEIVSRQSGEAASSTNRKVNMRVFQAAVARETIEVWFHSCPDSEETRRSRERQLIREYQPLWNG